MKHIGIALILFGAFVLAKSQFFEPSMNDGRKIIEKYVEDVSQGNMRLVAFQPTETAVIPERDGSAVTMSFEGSVECIGDDPAPGASAVAFTFDRIRLTDARPMKPGEHRYVKGLIRFEKATFGWVGKPM